MTAQLRSQRLNTATLELTAFDDLLDLLSMNASDAMQTSQSLNPEDASPGQYSFFCCFFR